MRDCNRPSRYKRAVRYILINDFGWATNDATIVTKKLSDYLYMMYIKKELAKVAAKIINKTPAEYRELLNSVE